MPANGRRIPPELDTYIIKHLVDDLRTLRAASLTCQSWSYAARPLKFREVTFQYVEDVLRLCELFDADPEAIDYVKSVEIRSPDEYAHPRLLAFSDPTKPRVRNVFSQQDLHAGRTPLFPVLRNSPENEPRFTNGDDNGEVTQLLTTTLRRCHRAVNLALYLCHIHNTSLADIISSIPGLKRLQLHFCDVYRPEGMDHAQADAILAGKVSSMPVIHHLAMASPRAAVGQNMPGVHDFFDFVLDMGLGNNAETLHITHSTMAMFQPHELLSRAQHTLLELKIGFTFRDTENLSKSAFDFGTK